MRTRHTMFGARGLELMPPLSFLSLWELTSTFYLVNPGLVCERALAIPCFCFSMCLFQQFYYILILCVFYFIICIIIAFVLFYVNMYFFGLISFLCTTNLAQLGCSSLFLFGVNKVLLSPLFKCSAFLKERLNWNRFQLGVNNRNNIKYFPTNKGQAGIKNLFTGTNYCLQGCKGFF